MHLPILGYLAAALLIAAVLLTVISSIVVKRKGIDTADRAAENVADLNDRFNRARYMSQDGN